MKKNYVYENNNQVLKNVERSLETLSDVSSCRELWNVVGQSLPSISCAKALFFRSTSHFDDQSSASKVQLFQGGFSAIKMELALSKEDVLALTQNTEPSKLIQLGSADFCHSLLLRGIENQRFRDAISGDLGRTFVTKHYGTNGFAGITIFKLKNEDAVDAKLTNVILASFFEAVHEKCSSLEFDENMRRVKITPREIDVLQLLAKGKSNAEIASNLEISKHTISSYVGILSLKLNSQNRTVTALRAIALGLAKA